MSGEIMGARYDWPHKNMHMHMRGGVIAYEHTCHSSDIKTPN